MGPFHSQSFCVFKLLHVCLYKVDMIAVQTEGVSNLCVCRARGASPQAFLPLSCSRQEGWREDGQTVWMKADTCWSRELLTLGRLSWQSVAPVLVWQHCFWHRHSELRQLSPGDKVAALPPAAEMGLTFQSHFKSTLVWGDMYVCVCVNGISVIKWIYISTADDSNLTVTLENISVGPTLTV